MNSLHIQVSETVTLAPDDATRIFRFLEQLYIDASNQLSLLTAIEELKTASEAGIRPLSAEKLAEFKRLSSEIPTKVRTRIKGTIQQVYEVFRETRLRAYRQTPIRSSEELGREQLCQSTRFDCESIRLGRQAAQKSGIPYMRAGGD